VEVKAHPWLKDMNWDSILKKEVKLAEKIAERV